MSVPNTTQAESNVQKYQILKPHFESLDIKISKRKCKGDKSSLSNARNYYFNNITKLDTEYLSIHDKMMKDSINSTQLHYIFNPIASRHHISQYKREATRDTDVAILAGCDHYSVWKSIEKLMTKKADDSKITKKQDALNAPKIEITAEKEKEIKELWKTNPESITNYFIENFNAIYQVFTYEYMNEIYIIPLACYRNSNSSQKKYIPKGQIIIPRKDEEFKEILAEFDLPPTLNPYEFPLYEDPCDYYNIDLFFEDNDLSTYI